MSLVCRAPHNNAREARLKRVRDDGQSAGIDGHQDAAIASAGI
jgi:hypothetical protein